MHRYFFQLTEGELMPDLEGTELVDLAAARRMAIDIATERLKGSSEELWKAGYWQVKIKDVNGTVLGAVSVTTANFATCQEMAEPGIPPAFS